MEYSRTVVVVVVELGDDESISPSTSYSALVDVEGSEGV